MKTLRETNLYGPCVTKGKVIGETAQFLKYQEHPIWGSQIRRVAKSRVGLHKGLHTESCPSCRDHPETMYPAGWMD